MLAKTKKLLIILIVTMTFVGCGKDRKEAQPAPSIVETEILLAYLEEQGNLLNSEEIPALIDARDVYQMLVASNVHIIDLRPAEVYAAGHIMHSVNISPANILYHFEQRIDPTGFDMIVLVCNDAQISSFVSAVLIFMGYDNVASLRFGLSSWDKEIAESHWLSVISDHLEGKLVNEPTNKHPKTSLPAIGTGHTNAYHILRTRAEYVLANDLSEKILSINDITENHGQYYIMNYVPESIYNRGHIPGAVQYTPKSSLHSSKYLETVPNDKPVVLYCFTGHHSSYATAFLRLLGYDAYHIGYGYNSFIHNTIKATERPGRVFTEERIMHYPLVGKNDKPEHLPEDIKQETPTPVIGGC